LKKQVYYFGCIKDPGHHLWALDTESLSRSERERVIPSDLWDKIDCWFAPNLNENTAVLPKPIHQSQGHAKLTHYDESATILSFWDRSVDHRPGSHSTFIASGIHTFEQMMLLTKEAFPKVWSRFGFVVMLAEYDPGDGIITTVVSPKAQDVQANKQ